MNNYCFKSITNSTNEQLNWLPHCHVDATCTFVPSQKGKFCVCNDGFQGSFVNLSLACKKTHVLIERILLSLDLIFRQWDPVCKQGNRNSGGSSWDNRGYYRFVQQVLYMMPMIGWGWIAGVLYSSLTRVWKYLTSFPQKPCDWQ